MGTREAPTKWDGRAVRRQVTNLVVAATRVVANPGDVSMGRSSGGQYHAYESDEGAVRA